jgi:hypothetical protein
MDLGLNNRDTASSNLPGKNDVNTVLTYGANVDWGLKPLTPRYAKVQGSTVFLFACLFLGKFHIIHAGTAPQVCVAVVGLPVGIALAFLFWKRPSRTTGYQIGFQLAFVLLMIIFLLRTL